MWVVEIWAQQDEEHDHRCHCGDHEVCCAEQGEAGDRGEYADDGADVFAALRPDPLVEEDDEEQRGEYEVESLRVEWDVRADHAAERGAGHPVQLVEERDPQVEPAAVHVFGDSCGGVDGERLVAHAEDEVWAFPAEAFESSEHRQSVEQVARVDHERQQERGDGVECGQQQVDGDEFHRSGEDEHAHAHGPDEREAFRAHEHAV